VVKSKLWYTLWVEIFAEQIFAEQIFADFRGTNFRGWLGQNV